MLLLRNVTPHDVELVFNWANDADVRLNSFHTNEINWADHEKWFHKKIETDTYWYILENENTSLGIIRFDLNEKSFLLNYSIAKQFRSFGYGKKIVELGVERLAKESKLPYSIEAHVKIENIASQKIFENLGFKKEKIENQLVFTKEIL